MTLHLTGAEILLRLLLAFVAGAVVGFNREAHSHAAGLRTTILVALAAAVAMIQANLLLPTAGRTADAFPTMDVMRLPLGVLTGVGFIGGGAILKRGGTVSGVTTAATLWIVTAIGLCFGGGQYGLGLATTVFAVVTIFAMAWIDRCLPRRRTAVVRIAAAGPSAEVAARVAPRLDTLLKPLGCTARYAGQDSGAGLAEVRYALRWTQTAAEDRTGAILAALGGLDVRGFDVGPEGET
ncbi:MgtC/SapB family protein [Methylobacterium sp. NEAU 140]|uniref:MgtC/SapB family protein n=1 Tax=Methylobacterium sp. NEAU 140 TaxID=3064945 RepID=UPI002733B6F3|nr:MgtC/SapB family protein [Methylobacterium sp. NEAU 140]MDP4023045.1 MgtC/SapB family protein [Methylobacterium sp. NEAU 140]